MINNSILYEKVMLDDDVVDCRGREVLVGLTAGEGSK